MSLAPLLKHVSPRWPPHLFSPETQSGLENLSAVLPALSGILLELRLNDSKICDLAVRASRHDGGLRSLSRHYAQAWTNAEEAIRVATLCLNNERGWSSVDNLGLEFDDVSHLEHGAAQTPALFFNFRETESSQTLANLKACLESLNGVTDWQISLFVELLEHRPKSATLHSVGTMLSRSNAPLRCCLSMTSHDLIAANEIFGLQLSASDLGFLSQAQACCQKDTLLLQFDVCDPKRRRIGFDLHARDDPCQRELLALLHRKRLCTPEKAEAVLNWPLTTTPLSEEQMALVSAVPHPAKQLLAIQRINHTKLVFEPGSGFTLAKIYLYVAFGWR